MNNSSISLDRSLVFLIKKKAATECGKTALKISSNYISQLNSYVDGTCNLSVGEIEEKIEYLVGCLTITLEYPMDDLEFLRVRRCEERKNFMNVDELSYIKTTTKSFPARGRLNQEGQSLFYATLIFDRDDMALQVALSEARSRNLDQLNVLKSRQKNNDSLFLRMIGIWAHVRRSHKPYYVGDNTYSYYKESAILMKKTFEPDLLLAYQITDRFFADVLSRKGSQNLYQVTAAIGAVIFSGNSCDGILYSSVEGNEEPVLALKPSSVDSKLEHQWVSEIIVENHLGYEFYKYQTRAMTKSIDRQNGALIW